MSLPLSADLIGDLNARDAAALEDDYDSFGRKLARFGIDIEAVKNRVAAFSVAVTGEGTPLNQRTGRRQT